jgi:manganese transport protein
MPNSPIPPNVTLERAAETGWRRKAGMVSLPEVHRSIVVPGQGSFWRKMAAFAGPGFLVAVGYMDPGNWATDLSGGAQFGYTLLAVVLISNFMAILLQHLCVKLGIATGRDLASLPRSLRYANHLVPLGHLRTGHCGVRSR